MKRDRKYRSTATAHEKDVDGKAVFHIACAVLLLAIAFHARSLYNGFIVHYDDSAYVLDNPVVRAGLSWDGIVYAFTQSYNANWHPLTMLSYMLDAQIFGVGAFGFHFTNLMLHAGSAVLLFLALRKMTGATWPAAFAVALFAVHPAHVEAVAQVAQRKDVLSAFFWMAGLYAYARYARRPSPRGYVLVAACFLFSLMSKPMAVTFPFVLLLLDYWPLRRMAGQDSPRQSVAGLVLEKVPLVALSVAVSIVTVLVQHESTAVRTLDEIPLALRAANALVAYAAYLRTLVWPVNLAAHYPYPHAYTGVAIVEAAALLVAITLIVIWHSRRYPWAIVGWCWFLGTLVPVIGLVQVGAQSRADRYTYVPFVGLYIVLSWMVHERCGHKPKLRVLIAVLGVLVVATFGAMTWHQTGYWRDNETLWRHAVAVTHDNPIVHRNLAVALDSSDRPAEAESEYRKTLELKPDDTQSNVNLGVMEAERGHIDVAESLFSRVTRSTPDLEVLMGNCLANAGALDKAEQHYRRALEADPQHAMAYYQMGRVCERANRMTEALHAYETALQLDPRLSNLRETLERLQSTTAH